MATFYKGYKTTNIVLENYFKGKFLCKDGKIEMLKLKTNKYNVEFIARINSINKLWYGTIIADKVVIELIKKNSDNEYVEISNIWRLIKAQSATVRYNRLLKSSLKQYEITKQKIYDEIKQDLNKQDERIIRNRKLLMELCKDYGLEFLINLVQKENNMDIIDHIVYYTDLIGKDLLQVGNKQTEEEVKAYYDEVTMIYIDYLNDLAEKQGKTLNNDISNSLKNARQIRNEKITNNKKEIAERKQIRHEERVSAIIADDSVQIQKELDASFDSRFIKLPELTCRIKLRDKIKANGGIIYYIATCKQTNVNYVSLELRLTSSIKRAALFGDKESAQAYIEKYSDALGLKNDIVKIQKLVIREVNVNTMEVYKMDAKARVTALETALSYDKPTSKEIEILKKLLYTKDYDYNNGEAIKYVLYAQCKDSENILFGKNGFLKEDYNSNSDELLTDIAYKIKYFNASDNDDIKEINECIRLLNNKGYSVTTHKIHIQNEFFNKLTLNLDAEHKFLVDVLSGIRDTSLYYSNNFEKIYGIKSSRNISYKSFTQDGLSRLEHKLNELNLKGDLFYVSGATSHSTRVLNIDNKHLSEGIQNATFFNSYEQAKSFIPQVLKEAHIAKVYSIYYK